MLTSDYRTAGTKAVAFALYLSLSPSIPFSFPCLPLPPPLPTPYAWIGNTFPQADSAHTSRPSARVLHTQIGGGLPGVDGGMLRMIGVVRGGGSSPSPTLSRIRAGVWIDIDTG